MPYPFAAVAHADSGPLRGLRFAVKDLFDIAGYPTGGGNPHVLARSGIRTSTAPVVQQLLDAGAQFVGKTHTDELAFSMNGKNAHYGAPVNGAAPERICGGSSSGSASAVSNSLCDFALGTDTGGSVRAPANHCGLFGIRPTHGRVSLDQCLPLSDSLDTCGYFARDIDVFARVSDVLLGPDSAPLPDIARLLLAEDVFALCLPEAREALRPVLAQVESALGPMSAVQAADRSFEDLYWAFRYVQGWEAWRSDGELIESFGLQLGADVAARFAFSKGVTEGQYQESVGLRQAFTAHLAALLGNDGVLVMPSMPDIAPLAAATGDALETYRNMSVQMLCLAGLSGFPQISLPLATRDGAPLGLSLLGPAGSDRALVALAERIVEARQ